MKKMLSFFLAAMMLVSLLTGCGAAQNSDSSTAAPSTPAATANSDDVYYMVTFLSTIEFWDDCWRGMQDSANVFGANVKYTGASAIDINEQITVLEQVIATKPAGITITCCDAEALKEPINKAIEQGIEVVCFDSDSVNSNRRSILATGNENACEQLAIAVAEELNGKGNVALIYGAGTPTYEARAAGVRAGIARYSDMAITAEGNYNGEQEDAARATAAIIQANPDIKAIFTVNASGSLGAAAAIREAGKAGQILVAGVDTDGGVYEAIDAGDVFATAKQGAYNMGFWAMQFLYCVKNNLVNPVDGWRENGLSPLPASVDTGVDIITKDNLAAFYTA